ncbi:hypothetical protein ACHAW6_000355, partial [Cyclotella cf. meneghiniana]
PQKTEKEQTPLTRGGNSIDYPWEVTTPTADLTKAKLLFNSVISTPGARFLTMDIKDFYLNTPMEHPEFMRLKYDFLPQEIITKYGLTQKVLNGWVNVRIEKGIQFTPGLWRHIWHPVTFSLVVDDFGIKVVGITHAKHLAAVLQKYYTVSVDWTGELFCGISLNWDYHKNTINFSMPGYIEKTLKHFQHAPPSQPQHAPYKSAPFQFGKSQQILLTDTTAALTPVQSSSFNKLLVPSCITQVLLIQHWQQHSAPLPPDKRTAPKQS